MDPEDYEPDEDRHAEERDRKRQRALRMVASNRSLKTTILSLLGREPQRRHQRNRKGAQ